MACAIVCGQSRNVFAFISRMLPLYSHFKCTLSLRFNSQSPSRFPPPPHPRFPVPPLPPPPLPTPWRFPRRCRRVPLAVGGALAPREATPLTEMSPNTCATSVTEVSPRGAGVPTVTPTSQMCTTARRCVNSGVKWQGCGGGKGGCWDRRPSSCPRLPLRPGPPCHTPG